MAIIRIIGGEALTVPNKELKQFIKDRENGIVKNSDIVSIGKWGGEAGQVKSWNFDNESISAENKFESEYQKHRQERLAMPLRQRAEDSAKESFALFCKGLFGHLPASKLIEENINNAEKFFKSNPKWSQPSVKVFLKTLEITEEEQEKEQKIVDKWIFDLFTRWEREEIREIKKQIKIDSVGNFGQEEEKFKINEW